ncbi:hypothetical protein OEIGOIKO_05839 [Streptomyces chrestomyceticus JCM 4735]|uniref:Uncharacterized protein n=1 Tax=Streptomyces chrestomyceticus JCM 4735 TaxID=1306181 RepID=A0A7U9KZ17_9ACTN|nr:hypothetical protein [Streptomyces chrestomyceticus]GCD38029.1 hypothetical protein OEIGOIKO_05839 [Streptomyces chrestomyceticus JCM 4735]
MPELTPSLRAVIDDVLRDETASADELRAAGLRLAAEVDRLRFRVGALTVLLEEAQREASTALARTGGES